MQNGNGRKRCGARTRSGGKCKNWAMPNGRCRMHGGLSPGRPIIHGRYSVVHRKSLADKVGKFISDPRPGDLTSELAITRALLEDYIERFPDGQPLPLEGMGHIFSMIDSIAKLVERISRILNQTALTQAELHFLQGRLVDILMTYIDDPDKRIRCLDEIEQSFGIPATNQGAYTVIEGR